MNVADAPSAATADVTPDLPGRLGVAVQMLAHAGKVSGGRADLTPTRLTALAVMALGGADADGYPGRAARCAGIHDVPDRGHPGGLRLGRAQAGRG